MEHLVRSSFFKPFVLLSLVFISLVEKACEVGFIFVSFV